MSSPDRKINVVPPSGAAPPGVEARLASLEDDAMRLRAEVEALQDDIRWLTDDEVESGWLARGWVRASLLLTAVGAVALVSVPYLSHLLDASGQPVDPAPVAAIHSAPITEPVAPVPSLPQASAREYVPAPVRERGTEIPEPSRVIAEERPARPTRPAVGSERHAAGPPDAAHSSEAPRRSESP